MVIASFPEPHSFSSESDSYSKQPGTSCFRSSIWLMTILCPCNRSLIFSDYHRPNDVLNCLATGNLLTQPGRIKNHPHICISHH